jgi:hypothetical protein
MKTELNGYILKEYGSWSILLIAWMIGVAVSRSISWSAFPLLFALGLLINSKQAAVKWLQAPSEVKAFIVFALHLLLAAGILAVLFKSDIVMLLPLLVFPMLFLVSGKLAGEHALLTEVLGFVLLSLAAVLAKYLLTGGLDVRLFLGVAFYFTAGVFKVKVLLLRKMKDRVLIVAHGVLALYVYQRMHIPLLILLPFIDNLIVAVYPYKVRLRTTGWIEVAKGLGVFGLYAIYY